MTDIFAKYPLAQKAAEETAVHMEGVFFFLGGEAACERAPGRIAEIIDQTIDDAPVMKEALIIGTFFSMNGDMMAGGVPDDFEDVYTPEARMIVDEMFIMANLEGASPSDQVLKTQAVFAIASLEALKTLLTEAQAAPSGSNPSETKKELSQEMIQGMKEQIAEDEKRLLPGLGDAPKLRVLYFQAKNDIFAMIEKPAAENRQDRKPPEPGA